MLMLPSHAFSAFLDLGAEQGEESEMLSCCPAILLVPLPGFTGVAARSSWDERLQPSSYAPARTLDTGDTRH